VRRLAERAGGDGEVAGPATPGWLFHAGTLAWCNSLLANAGDADLLVVDELGPLELEQNGGWIQGIRAVDAGRFRMGLLVVRPRLLPLAQTRWPDALILGLGDPTEVPGRVHEVLRLADSPGASALRAL